MSATATPPRPNPAVLNSPELEAWAKAALPQKLLISMAGRIWALNAHRQVIAVKPPSLVCWHPLEADPVMAQIGPFDVCATIPLWDDLRTPWEDLDLLHALEALMTLPQTAGRRRTGRGRGRARKSPFGTAVHQADLGAPARAWARVRCARPLVRHGSVGPCLGRAPLLDAKVSRMPCPPP
jgi:hypothetical protein